VKTWPIGPRKRDELEATAKEVQALVDLDAAEWLDPPLKPGEWERLLADPGAMRRHMQRLHDGDTGEDLEWRVYTQMCVIRKHGTDAWRVIQNFAVEWANGNPDTITDSLAHQGFRTICEIVFPGAFLTSVDWYKMFYQIPTSRRTRMGSMAWVGGRRVLLRGAAMGISVIPSASQRISNVVCDLVVERCPWARAAACIDDLYQSAPSFIEGLQTIQVLYDVCTRLRIALKPAKCDHWPHTTKPVLRNTVNTATARCYTHSDTVRKIRTQCSAFIDRVNEQKAVTQREIASLIGVANSCADTSWQMFFSCAGLRDLLKRMIRQGAAGGREWDAAFRLDMEAEWAALADAERLRTVANWGGRSMLPFIAEEFVVADGGPMAGGALALSVEGKAAILSNANSTDASTIAMRALTSAALQAIWSQNRNEMEASTNAVFTFARTHLWYDKVVAVIVDSRTVRAYLSKGGPKFDLAHAAARFHQRMLEMFNVHVVCIWSSGKSLFLADEWSRTKVNRPRWMEAATARRIVDAEWGVHTLDCFGSVINRWCARYISCYPETCAELMGVDFFSMNLTDVLRGERAIGRPPARRVMETLQALQRAEAESFTLITRGWPSATVMTVIITMLTTWPVFVPYCDGLYETCWEPTLKEKERETWSEPKGTLCAWPLSGRPCMTKAFQNENKTRNWAAMPTEKVEQLTTRALSGSAHGSKSRATTSLRAMLRLAAF